MAAGAHIRIDQATNPVPTGTYDQGRDDVRQAVQVQLVGDANSGGNVSPQWTLLDKPPGATASIASGSTFAATLTGDKPGPYRVQLLVNDGLAANGQIKVFRVTADANGNLIDGGICPPAYGELSTEGNAGGNARGYAVLYEAMLAATVITVALVANLRANIPNRHTRIRATHHTTAQDDGGGIFRWNASSTAADDGGCTIAPTGVATGRWEREATGALQAAWYGVQADGRKVADAVLTASANTLTSATAAFAITDQGKRALVRMPSLPSSNAVTLNNGSNTITGTGFNADFALLAGIPRTGGGLIFLLNDASVGAYRAVLVGSDTALTLYTPSVIGSATSKTLYRETQAECFVKYVSATQITLWSDAGFTTPVNAIFSETAVPLFFATDDTAALDKANLAVVARGGDLFYPKGLIGIYSNLRYQGANNVSLYGHGRDATILCDLRKASSERPNATVEANGDHGILSFSGSGNNIHFYDMSYDANLHIPGMAHSTGGVSNAAGGRIGFFMRGINNPGFHRLGSMGGVGGFGARDEHIYHDTNCTNAVIEDCVLGDAAHPTNGPGLNPVSGDGVRIQNNTVTSHYAALECTCDSPIITGNHFSNYAVYPIGAPPCIVSNRGRVVFCHNEVRDSDTTTGTVAAVEFQYAGGQVCTLTCTNNLFSNLKGLYGSSVGSDPVGVIRLDRFVGTALIAHNVGDNIRSIGSYVNGRFIRIIGAGTSGKIYVGDNTFNPNPSSGVHLMGVGLSVKADVPRFIVTVLPGNNFSGCATPYELLTAVDISRDFGEMRLGQYLQDVNQTVQVGSYSDTFTVNTGTDVATSAGTLLLINGDEVTLSSSADPPTLPGGLAVNTPYYVLAVAGNTFKLAATRGGAAIDITSAGAGTHTVSRAGGNRFVMPEATMTGNRNVTAGTGGSPATGEIFRFERRDASANTLVVVNGGPGAGTLYTFPASPTSPSAVDIRFDGTNWAFSGKAAVY